MNTPWASTAWALCATQYSSEYMDVAICRDGFVYDAALRKGRELRRR